MSEQDKPYLVNKKLRIPFGVSDLNGDRLTRQASEEVAKKFKETGEINITGHGSFKVLNVFLEYNLANPERGEIVLSGEFPVMLPRFDEVIEENDKEMQ